MIRTTKYNARARETLLRFPAARWYIGNAGIARAFHGGTGEGASFSCSQPQADAPRAHFSASLQSPVLFWQKKEVDTYEKLFTYR